MTNQHPEYNFGSHTCFGLYPFNSSVSVAMGSPLMATHRPKSFNSMLRRSKVGVVICDGTNRLIVSSKFGCQCFDSE